VLALALARAGADVVISYNRSADDAVRTEAARRPSVRISASVQADVSDGAQVRRLVNGVAEKLGRLDVLVNSASMFERAPFMEIEEDDWDRVLAVNLRGPFLLMRAAAPLLREHGGVIINIADLSAFQVWPSYAHHSVSKAGLVHLTRVAARALAPAIRVNCIAPGTVLPPEDVETADDDGGSERRLTTRRGRPEDVADAMLYLIGADFVTGETIRVDGGRLAL
jgi:NAD(P)-dependent dehydrogenase (short-subunit alcohol dehydrogenase family)